MAAIVVSMLPVLNLLWINFSFVFHVLFLGTLWDYYDLGKYAKPYIHTYASLFLNHPTVGLIPSHHFVPTPCRVVPPRHPPPPPEPERQDLPDGAHYLPGERPRALLAPGLLRGDGQARVGRVSGLDWAHDSLIDRPITC